MTTKFLSEIDKISRYSFSSSTLTAYSRTWQNFGKFLASYKLALEWPIPAQTIASYIVRLCLSNLKLSTIRSQLSALSYQHKICSLNDNTNSYIVKRLVSIKKGYNSEQYKLHPIGKVLLQKMLKILEQTLGNSYKGSFYKALFLFAYYACLRAGEIVVSNSKVHTLHFENLSFMDKGSLALRMQIFKHCSEPVTLMIFKLPTEPYCPVIAIANY